MICRSNLYTLKVTLTAAGRLSERAKGTGVLSFDATCANDGIARQTRQRALGQARVLPVVALARQSDQRSARPEPLIARLFDSRRDLHHRALWRRLRCAGRIKPGQRAAHTAKIGLSSRRIAGMIVARGGVPIAGLVAQVAQIARCVIDVSRWVDHLLQSAEPRPVPAVIQLHAAHVKATLAAPDHGLQM